jgi:hypothetical protein
MASGQAAAVPLEQCFTILAQRICALWILEGGIRACFDEISHEWLLKHVPMDKELLRAWLKAGYWEKGQLFPTNAGTPNDSISSLLPQLPPVKFGSSFSFVLGPAYFLHYCGILNPKFFEKSSKVSVFAVGEDRHAPPNGPGGTLKIGAARF